jgi:hypothetical protein
VKFLAVFDGIHQSFGLPLRMRVSRPARQNWLGGAKRTRGQEKMARRLPEEATMTFVLD